MHSDTEIKTVCSLRRGRFRLDVSWKWMGGEVFIIVTPYRQDRKSRNLVARQPISLNVESADWLCDGIAKALRDAIG